MKIPTDVSWNRVVNALKKIGFVVRREGKHTAMTKGENIVIIPRHKRIKRETLRDIINDAAITIEDFKELL